MNEIANHGLNWTEIAKTISGRCPLSLKNRQYAHLRKFIQPTEEVYVSSEEITSTSLLNRSISETYISPKIENEFFIIQKEEFSILDSKNTLRAQSHLLT